MVQSTDPTSPHELDVFEYVDLRTFLGDYYAMKKEQGRGFSYRYFSRRAGLGAPNHLKRVIDGERPLTAPMALRYADAIGLVDDARAYFLDLAALGRGQSVDERNAAYERLTRYRRSRSAQKLEVAHATYHSSWYIPAIRELVDLGGFREDPAWIAQALVPSITRNEAAKGLQVLQDLGMLVRDASGALVQSETAVTTGAEARGLHIANYHRAMMARAAESIDVVGRSERDISSLTFSCSNEVLTEIKDRLVKFRRELIALISESESDAERIVQLNFQMFPLSNVVEPE